MWSVASKPRVQREPRAAAGGRAGPLGRRGRYRWGLVAAFLLSSVAVGSELPRFVAGPASSDWTRPVSPEIGSTASLALAASDASSLLSLATEKRLSGDLDQAKRAYVAVRSRFQSSIEAGHATFWLGEMEFSNRKDYADAALWFETYLREWPHGAFTARAQARLMESLYRDGDFSGAMRLANQCFAEHANGPESEVTLSILRSEDLPE